MCAGQDPGCSYPDLSPAGTRRVAFVVGEAAFPFLFAVGELDDQDVVVVPVAGEAGGEPPLVAWRP